VFGLEPVRPVHSPQHVAAQQAELGINWQVPGDSEAGSDDAQGCFTATFTAALTASATVARARCDQLVLPSARVARPASSLLGSPLISLNLNAECATRRTYSTGWFCTQYSTRQLTNLSISCERPAQTLAAPPASGSESGGHRGRWDAHRPDNLHLGYLPYHLRMQDASISRPRAPVQWLQLVSLH
jgi:hypothetical protein